MLRIGELARCAGVTAQTIRYYERVGVLERPARSTGGYRQYTNRSLEELAFVKRAQALGFSLDDIREIVDLSRRGQRPCSRVLDLARKHVSQLQTRIQELGALRGRLARALRRWEAEGIPADCAATLCGLISTASRERPTYGKVDRHLALSIGRERVHRR